MKLIMLLCVFMVCSAKKSRLRVSSFSVPEETTTRERKTTKRDSAYKKFIRERNRVRGMKHAGEFPHSYEPPLYTVVETIECTNPYTTEEIDHFQEAHGPNEVFEVDPSRLRFMHAAFSNKFSDGRSVEETTNSLLEDIGLARHLTPIHLVVIEYRGEKMLFTQDHRRVLAFLKANEELEKSGKPAIKIRAQFPAGKNIKVRANFTSQTLGLSTEVREYRDGGAHQRGRSTLPRSAEVYSWAT